MIEFLTFGVKTHRCNAMISGYYTSNALQPHTMNSEERSDMGISQYPAG